MSGEGTPGASGLRIVLAEPRDPRLFALLAERFPRGLAARYDWLYAGNPHGHALSWLALDANTGEPAGCTSLFPRRVLVDGRPRIGSIGGDCFVAPRFRRRGVATLLHRESLAGMRAYGVDFMYGPPNEKNLGALLKAGSQVVNDFIQFLRPLSVEALRHGPLRRVPWWALAPLGRAGLAFLRGVTRPRFRVTLEPVTVFGPDFDALGERVVRSHRVVCLRDPAYLAWRYLAAPAGKQRPFAVRRGPELVGFAAVEMAGERADLVDIFTPLEADLIDATVQAAMDHVAAAGCSGLEVSAISSSLTARRLRHLGFISRGTAAFQVAAAADDRDAAILRAEGAWHFTEGDKDQDEKLALRAAKHEAPPVERRHS